MTDIVERLRRYAEGTKDWETNPSRDELDEAADTITALRAEVETLRGALDVAEVTLRLDGRRMRDRSMSTKQSEAGLATVQAALNGGDHG